eukprot:TRINITY_DN11185_c0_g1_i1.p1 TRINITY_DN11185_c0_g1~~TRINITY_DN11185_c0_g1_i1.p1  ORF type:complete len:996 (-),score=177.81 TRINITY_DN11185_c0_g1_i1:63-2729(-)
MKQDAIKKGKKQRSYYYASRNMVKALQTEMEKLKVAATKLVYANDSVRSRSAQYKDSIDKLVPALEGYHKSLHKAEEQVRDQWREIAIARLSDDTEPLDADQIMDERRVREIMQNLNTDQNSLAYTVSARMYYIKLKYVPDATLADRMEAARRARLQADFIRYPSVALAEDFVSNMSTPYPGARLCALNHSDVGKSFALSKGEFQIVAMKQNLTRQDKEVDMATVGRIQKYYEQLGEATADARFVFLTQQLKNFSELELHMGFALAGYAFPTLDEDKLKDCIAQMRKDEDRSYFLQTEAIEMCNITEEQRQVIAIRTFRLYDARAAVPQCEAGGVRTIIEPQKSLMEKAQEGIQAVKDAASSMVKNVKWMVGFDQEAEEEEEEAEEEEEDAEEAEDGKPPPKTNWNCSEAADIEMLDSCDAFFQCSPDKKTCHRCETVVDSAGTKTCQAQPFICMREPPTFDSCVKSHAGGTMGLRRMRAQPCIGLKNRLENDKPLCEYNEGDAVAGSSRAAEEMLKEREPVCSNFFQCNKEEFCVLCDDDIGDDGNIAEGTDCVAGIQCDNKHCHYLTDDCANLTVSGKDCEKYGEEVDGRGTYQCAAPLGSSLGRGGCVFGGTQCFCDVEEEDTCKAERKIVPKLKVCPDAVGQTLDCETVAGDCSQFYQFDPDEGKQYFCEHAEAGSYLHQAKHFLSGGQLGQAEEGECQRKETDKEEDDRCRETMGNAKRSRRIRLELKKMGCSRWTGGTCKNMKCSASRGNVSCIDGYCMCPEGVCSENGACVQQKGCQPATDGSCRFQDCDASRNAGCKEGVCVCAPGFCAEDGVCEQAQDPNAKEECETVETGKCSSGMFGIGGGKCPDKASCNDQKMCVCSEGFCAKQGKCVPQETGGDD